MQYVVVIQKDDENNYGVTVPDLPGCFSAGATLDEALQETAEAIECHLQELLLEGEPVPAPGQIEHHQNNPDYAGGIWALIAVNIANLSGKSKRVNITLPECVLSIVDKYASEQRMTRSGLIAEATMEYITSRQ